jgi:drug/metabolite transporter (DMT)-like permease
MILAGSGATIVAKLMTEKVENADSTEKFLSSDFHHPLVLSLLMFLGQALFLPFQHTLQFFMPASNRK